MTAPSATELDLAVQRWTDLPTVDYVDIPTERRRHRCLVQHETDKHGNVSQVLTHQIERLMFAAYLRETGIISDWLLVNETPTDEQVSAWLQA